MEWRAKLNARVRVRMYGQGKSFTAISTSPARWSDVITNALVITCNAAQGQIRSFAWVRPQVVRQEAGLGRMLGCALTTRKAW